MLNNIHSRTEGNDANSTGHESGADWCISTKSDNDQVHYTWDDVKDTNRNLALFELYLFMLDFVLLKPTLPC